MSAVEFRHVDFRIGDRAILNDLTLSVEAGETLVLLGRSGSGKTTALRLINGMILPSAGEVRVDDKSTAEWDLIRLRRANGYVIQEGGLFPHFTVTRNIGLVPRLEGWPESKITARVSEMLERVSLPADFAQRFPHELSGGQRQRVGVARALAADPKILLFDEPFGALDPVTRLELQREFLRLRADFGKTSVFVTHDVQEAMKLATRIALLHEGRLAFLGSPADFTGSEGIRKRARFSMFYVRRAHVLSDVLQDLLDEGWQLLGEHLLLVVSAMLIASAMAIPAGVMLASKPRARRWALGVANIGQTIPSLALFGFLIPIPFIGGIGPHTAIVALVLYALLPILRNTVTGILGVDAVVRDSAVAMGMTPGQILRMVELPLAAPTIIAGLRIATVTTIGTATIAAAIGAGGLGVFIFRGIASVDKLQILAGAVPAALLALAADGALGWLEKRLVARQTR